MAERSWFFNAEQTGEDEYDRVYLAEDFAKYFSLFISNGVFPNPSTGLQVLAQEVPNMTVTLKPGFAFINGYGYENTSDYKFTIDTADGVLNREDSIFIRWYLTDRKIAAYKAVGTPGAEASHVDLIRTEDYWDLCVARIMVEAGVTSITQSAITDTRLNTDLCGIVATLVDQVDTTTLYNQIQADLEEFQNVSEEDFTKWYNQQQQMFTTWYQQQQQMFTSWYQQQQEDFDEWFDDINAKLGTEPATALQQQIDEINTSIEENSDRMFSTYRHVKNGTTHTFIGSGSNGKVKMTADVGSGDTVVVSSVPKNKVTVQGKTSQPGTGDPSPNNIRMIDGVGMYDQMVVFDGSSSGFTYSWNTSTSSPFLSIIISDAPLVKSGSKSKSSYLELNSVGSTSLYNIFALASSASGIYANIRLGSDKVSTQSEAAYKEYLSSHPLTVWYKSVDYAKSTGPFYTVVELSDEPYRAVGFELNQPLFDGDSLKVGGKSGCDQMIVLDGSEDEKWTTAPLDSDKNRYAIKGVVPVPPKTAGSVWATHGFSNLYPFIPITVTSKPGVGIGGEYVYIADKSSFLNVEELKAYLSINPLTIFYRSVNYTEENDIPVALESCKSFYKTFDGTEEFTLAYSGEDANEYDLVLNGAGTILPTSSDANASCSHFKKGNFTVDGNWQATSMSNDVTIQFFRSKTDCPDVNSFKQWLQEEYENGTPVQCVMSFTKAVEYAHLAQPESLPAYYSVEDFVTALAGEDVAGKWLSFTNDGVQLNFKGGGGLGSSKLAAADAVAANVLSGKKFYAGNKIIKTGTMPERGTWNETYAGTDITVPDGHHSGTGKITVDGGNQGAKTTELMPGGTYGIPKGWHNGNGKVTTPSMASLTVANAEDRDIISDKTAWVNGSKRTGTLQDLGYEPKGTGCTLRNGGVYIYFGDSSNRYALSKGIWYPQGDIKNILSFIGSGSSGDKSGSYAEIYRNESNVTREIQARSHASASINGKTVTITVHAEAYQRANDIPSLSGTKSSVDYSFSFTIS